MRYIYYQSEKGNFGDDLNAILWPKIFSGSNLEEYFFGIGSILYNENPLLKSLSGSNKIVFGTGIRPSYYSEFKTDSTWNIKFLRGPLSANILNNKFKYISDAAYALRYIPEYRSYKNVKKKYNVSVMPYFRSMDYFHWEEICKKLGYHLISPFSENGVESTMMEIASSKYLITEAMHGAIVADTLRIPWNKYVLTTPYTEGQMISEFKWMDWQLSIDMPITKTTHINFYKKTSLARRINKISKGYINIGVLFKEEVNDEIISKLSNIKDYHLSKDSTISQIDSQIFDQVVSLKNEINMKNITNKIISNI